MNLWDEQIARELDAVQRGVMRYNQQRKADSHIGREFDGPVGQSFTTELMGKLVPDMARLQRFAMRSLLRSVDEGRQRAKWWAPLNAVSAEELAYITIRSILVTPHDKRIRPKMASRIGAAANLQARYNNLRELERDRAKGPPRTPNRLRMLENRVKVLRVRNVQKWLRDLSDLEATKWDRGTANQVGLAALLKAVESLGEYFEWEQWLMKRRGRTAVVERLNLTEAAERKLDEQHGRFALESPWLEPMLVEPLDWKQGPDGEYRGGYLKLPEPLVTAKGDIHAAEVIRDFGVPTRVLGALNRVQRTAWATNEAVLEVVEEAIRRGLGDLLSVNPEMTPLPADLPKDVWEAMSPEAKAEIKMERSRIHDENNKKASKRQVLRRQAAIARGLGGRAFYFPHMLDFRGRMYPMPQDLHPQSDDLGRALLMFHKGKPLGARGLRWLAYTVANTYGLDKAGRDEQFDWVVDHMNGLSVVAKRPLDEGYEFLLGAEEPWQFLAAAIELEAAFASGDPENYVSHLPVNVDGSCNGLQHLSAMGLDPEGAHATNLTSDPVRQDIYQIVADKVVARVDQQSWEHEQGFGKPKEWALAPNWSGKVTRKTVKRGVMTVPYGLTDIGMRDQLISDGWTADLEGPQRANASYLRDLMKDAIAGTVKSATEIMGWMQDNASILAKNGKAVRWETPSGLVVQQSYRPSRTKRVRTVLGVGAKPIWTSLAHFDHDDPVRVSKQVSGIAPNIIHSFDAAHLVISIWAAPDDMSFSVVHDSYGCHACDMPAFLEVIKEQFCWIYSEDWFERLQGDFEASRDTMEFPLIRPPERGGFVIEEVLNSNWFFA